MEDEIVITKKYKIVDVTEPKDGYEVYKDYFWLCVDGKPEKALLYKGLYPQCNKSVLALEFGFVKSGLPKNISVVHIPVAYVKHLPE